MRVARGPLALGLLVAAAGCGWSGPVPRVVDGRVIEGNFVSDLAYAEFLRGAVAEAQADPDLPAALGHYRAAARADSSSPELWTRIARLRCRMEGGQGPEEDVAHALSLDPRYEPALALSRICDALHVARAGPPVDDESPLPALADPSSRPTDDAERRRLEALTLLHGDRVGAWEALATWGALHGDVLLEVRGLIGVAARAPGKRFSLAKEAVSLAGMGYRLEARALAVAVMDAPGDRSAGGMGPAPGSLPLVPRLAMDDALLRGDVEQVRRIVSRAHLPVAVAAGRALAMGKPELARDLTLLPTRADPADLASRLMRDAAEGRATSRSLPRGASDALLPPEVTLTFARQVLLSESVAAARQVLSLGGGAHPEGADSSLLPIAIELALAGVIADGELPAEARIELAARRGVPPEPADVEASGTDARHALLGRALASPSDPDVRERARRLAPAALEDAVVAVALARVALGGGESLPVDARSFLAAIAPGDALAAATLVDLATHGGTPAEVTHAKRELAALARTPAETARATE
jgi:hypothetical protein